MRMLKLLYLTVLSTEKKIDIPYPAVVSSFKGVRYTSDLFPTVLWEVSCFEGCQKRGPVRIQVV